MTDTPDFRIVLRGFDPVQVQAHLDDLTGEVAALRARLENAEQDVPAEPVGFEHLGARMLQILTLAEQEAGELRESATAEAEQLRTETEQDASLARDQVALEVQTRRADADAEIRDLLDAARLAAQETREEADREAAALRHEAASLVEEQRAVATAASLELEQSLAQRRATADDEHADRMSRHQSQWASLEEALGVKRAEGEAAHADAVREARRIVEDAQLQADGIVGEAKAAADRIRAQSERELAAAVQRRDSINDQLANVREMLVTLTGRAPSEEEDLG